MVNHNVFRRVFALVACFCLMFISVSCTTHRVFCNPAPEKRTVDLPATIRFKLESVAFVGTTNVSPGNLADFGVYYLSDAVLRDKLAAKARDEYPKLFSDDAGSVPLQVTITRSSYSSDANILNGCTWCLTLTIYPLSQNDTIGYTVQVKSTRSDLNAKLESPVSFSRDVVGRLSCFPTGLIPARGKGDLTWGDPTQSCEKVMLSSCVNAIVTSLQRLPPKTFE